MLMTQCDRLLNSQLRLLARTNVCQLIYESYLYIYEKVMEPNNLYEQVIFYD